MFTAFLSISQEIYVSYPQEFKAIEPDNVDTYITSITP